MYAIRSYYAISRNLVIALADTRSTAGETTRADGSHATVRHADARLGRSGDDLQRERHRGGQSVSGSGVLSQATDVITSYSIHYTKLYDGWRTTLPPALPISWPAREAVDLAAKPTERDGHVQLIRAPRPGLWL